MWCFKNAERMMSVSLNDRAFQYGDGCFTTGRIQHGQIELESRHIARLKHACEQLALAVDLDFIEQTQQHLQQHFEQVNGRFKVIISRGEGERGYSLPNHDADLWLFFYPQALEAFHYDVIEVDVLTQRLGQTMPKLLGIKSLNRLEQVMLKQEADQKKLTEALVLDVQNHIVEGVSSNCFLKINNIWVTPNLQNNGIYGIMRAEILARMQQFGIACEVRKIDFDECANIQSLFFCNALSPMKIASSLGQQNLDTQTCIDLFYLLQLQQTHSYVQFK